MIGFNDTNEANLLALLDDITRLQLPVDTFWLDAGWNAGGFPSMQGNPEADPVRFPRGLAPLGRAVDQAGLRCLVWFEPERAMLGSWLQREHPDWLLQPSALPDSLAYLKNDGFFLLDLGDPEAREWAVESVSRSIREAKIDIYRQDCNLYPAYFWHTAEPPDEMGLREVRFINGLYTFLDELVRRNPGLIIDNCAAGGRRLDFEMLRRSVVLWRSDSTWGEPAFPRNVQAMTLGLSHWLPLHGLGANAADDISLRSGMGVCASYAINYRDPASVEALRRHLDRYLPVRMLYAADFYPLTDWNNQPEEWLAFQFHDPATGAGIIQAFRGPTTESHPLRLQLRGLQPERRYVFSNWDDATVRDVRTGADLLSSGLEVTATGAGAQAIVLQYRFYEPAADAD
jgi:alpha-galactosidase